MNVPSFRAVVGRSHTETAFVLMLLSIFVGTVIDDLGTRLEGSWLDRWRNARTRGKHREEWWAYLCKPFIRLSRNSSLDIALAIAPASALFENPGSETKRAVVSHANRRLLHGAREGGFSDTIGDIRNS